MASVPGSAKSDKRSRLWFRVGASLLALLSAVHVYHLVAYSIDVPVADGWESLNPNRLGNGVRLEWLFGQHNEHRPVFSRLLIWLVYRFANFNLHVLNMINLGLYAGFVLSVFHFQRGRFCDTSRLAVIFFGLFLVSTRASENLDWSFQNCFHLFTLFFLWGTYYLFSRQQTWRTTLSGTFLVGAAMYTLAGGIPVAVGLLVTYIPFKMLRMKRSRPHRQLELRQLLAAAGVLVSLGALWFSGYKGIPGHPPYTYPHEFVFWQYWMTTVSAGFGFETLSFWLGGVVLACVVFPIVHVAYRAGLPKSAADWDQWSDTAFFVGLCCGLFAFFAAISMGRSAWWPHSAYASRYSQISLLFLVCAVFAWGRWLSFFQTRRPEWVFATLWLLALVGFHNNWSYGVYRLHYKERMGGLECIRNYYLHNGPDVCLALYPFHLSNKLEVAKELNVSFFKKLFPQGLPQGE